MADSRPAPSRAGHGSATTGCHQWTARCFRQLEPAQRALCRQFQRAGGCRITRVSTLYQISPAAMAKITLSWVDRSELAVIRHQPAVQRRNQEPQRRHPFRRLHHASGDVTWRLDATIADLSALRTTIRLAFIVTPAKTILTFTSMKSASAVPACAATYDVYFGTPDPGAPQFQGSTTQQWSLPLLRPPRPTTGSCGPPDEPDSVGLAVSARNLS